MLGYMVKELSRSEVEKLDHVKILEKVAYAQKSDKSVPVKSISLLTPDEVIPKSFFENLFHHSTYHGIFLQQQEGDNDPFGFMLYSAQEKDEAMSAFCKVTAILAPILDAGYVALTKKLLKEIILPVPKEPETLTFDIIALMKSKPNMYPHWVVLLQSLLEFSSSKDDEEAVQTLLRADPELAYGESSKSHNLMHSLVRQKSEKTIAALVYHSSTDHADYAEQVIDEEEEETDAGLEEEEEKAYEWHRGQRKTKLPRQLSYLKLENLLNVFDSDGTTPLMLSVQEEQADSALQLLMGGADPNIAQPSTGDTALHLATQLASVQLVKLVVAYGGNISSVNKKSQTPMDIAKEQGNEEIVAVLEEVKAAEDVAKEAKGTEVKLEPGSLSLLSLDGGGIRAMMTAQLLLAIENKMKALDPTCKPVTDYFDYVAGTSMGGVIAAVTATGKFDATNLHKVIFIACDRVFSGKKQDRVQRVESVLADLIGADMKMSKRLKPRFMIAAAIVNRIPSPLHFFTNFGESDNDQPSPEDQDVIGALRASTAAPYYFTPYKGMFADGGIAANNPTLAAMAKIVDQTEKEKKAQNIGCVVSLGTGVFPDEIVEDIDIFIPNLSNALFNIRSKLSGMAHFLDILMYKATESSGQPVTEARAWCKTINCPYFRINPLLPRNIPLDSIDRNDIIALMYTAHIHILEEAAMIETIACALLSKKD